MIKNLKYIVLFLIFGCSAPKVVYDYDVKTDFSKYKTYHFFEDAGDGLNGLDIERFVRSIDYHLDSIGIQKEEKPSFHINFISEKRELTGNGIGIGLGTGRRNVGVGVSTGITLGGNKINEKIIIDFVDSKSNQLFWQGVFNVKVSEKIKPKDRVILVRNIVKKILSNYPPK